MAVLAEEHWAKKGDVDLFLYRKVDSARADAVGQPVLLLVHGSSESGTTAYDLTVPGQSRYSMMEVFAESGFDVWTVDHEGYGRSSRTRSNSNVRSGVDDLKCATDFIFQQTGLTNVLLYGQSSGALRAALFTETFPERVARLVLDAFVYTGQGSPTLAKRREHLAQWRDSNTRPVDSSFYHSMFERDLAGTSDPAVADAFANAEANFGGSVPTGTYLDMCTSLPLNDPAKIRCPVLIIRGEHDGIATEADVVDYFKQIAAKEKMFAVLPGIAHISPLSRNRELFFHIVRSFLETPMPQPI